MLKVGVVFILLHRAITQLCGLLPRLIDFSRSSWTDLSDPSLSKGDLKERQVPCLPGHPQWTTAVPYETVGTPSLRQDRSRRAHQSTTSLPRRAHGQLIYMYKLFIFILAFTSFNDYMFMFMPLPSVPSLHPPAFLVFSHKNWESRSKTVAPLTTPLWLAGSSSLGGRRPPQGRERRERGQLIITWTPISMNLSRVGSRVDRQVL